MRMYTKFSVLILQLSTHFHKLSKCSPLIWCSETTGSHHKSFPNARVVGSSPLNIGQYPLNLTPLGLNARASASSPQHKADVFTPNWLGKISPWPCKSAVLRAFSAAYDKTYALPPESWSVQISIVLVRVEGVDSKGKKTRYEKWHAEHYRETEVESQFKP